MNDRQHGIERRVSIALALVLVLATIGLIVYVVAPIPATPGDTEFYLLNESGAGAGYPESLAVSESATVVAGVENHEHEERFYEVVVVRGDERLHEGSETLADGDRWTENVTLSFDSPGSKEVEFRLYRDDDADPYRELFLRVDVSPEP